MPSSNNAINNTVGASVSGVTNTFTITNASNTASSAARSTITVGGGTAADPTLNFNVAATTDWEMGIDNSSSDSFKLSQGTALGTNDTFIMTTAGERTMPLQPTFSAFLNATVNNVTGDGTTYTIICDSEVEDRGSDYNIVTGTFTAPVSGTYLLKMSVGYIGLSGANTEGQVSIITSNRSYVAWVMNYWAINFNTGGVVPFTTLADMDALDTATMHLRIVGGALVVDVQAGSADMRTSFQGFLVD